MSIVRFLLPLVLASATCRAGNPIFEPVEPVIFDVVPTDYRLPTNVQPTNYNISLVTYVDINAADLNFTFEGTSIISLEARRSTNKITFHAKELNIQSTELEYETTEKGKPIMKFIRITHVSQDKQRDFVHLTLAKYIPLPEIKKYTLTLTYKGKINDQLRGFYRSSYLDNHKRRWAIKLSLKSLKIKKKTCNQL